MKKLNLKFLTLLFSVLTLSGCFIDINEDGDGPFNCIDGSGSLETQTLDIDEFTGIKTELSVDVFITQGDDFSVEVNGKDNIIEDLNLDISSGIWEIDTEHCVRDIGDMKIYITMPTIDYLKIHGSGKIVSENTLIVDDIELLISGSGDIDLSLEADDIYSKISGSGEIWLEGIADQLDFKISGSGDLNTYDLETNKVDIRISGSGDSRIKAIEELDVKITGSGSVYYKGDPSINVQITGSGSLIDAN